jgi:catechol 2,3-dioxygenase-like lactoylglutathione lyase family enzyme
MIRTQGLTHIHLAVRDLPRSVSFYTTVLGMESDASRSNDTMVFLRTPGAQDTLTLRLAAPDEAVGSGGGVDHFGFRLQDRGDLDEAIRLIEAAGGRLLERGEHAPGVPYAYVADPEGYVLEF